MGLPTEVSESLPNDFRAPEVARQFIARQLAGQPRDDILDAQLVASEFVTAVIVRGRRPRAVSVLVDTPTATIHVAVTDGEVDRTNRAPSFVLERISHEIVTSVVDRWGTDVDPAGHVVLWCEMHRPVGPQPGGSEVPDLV